MIRSGFSLQQG
ncbi:hypothetical protein YPPY13_2946, partial [Yersinia pestis PY-13]